MGKNGLIEAIIKPIFGASNQYQLVIQFKVLGMEYPYVLVSIGGHATKNNPLHTTNFMGPPPKVMNGATALNYYATWNGVDSFVLHTTYDFSSPLSDIRRFVNSVNGSQPTPAPTPSHHHSSTTPYKTATIALSSATGALLVAALVLAILFGKKKHSRVELP